MSNGLTGERKFTDKEIKQIQKDMKKAREGLNPLLQNGNYENVKIPTKKAGQEETPLKVGEEVRRIDQKEEEKKLEQLLATNPTRKNELQPLPQQGQKQPKSTPIQQTPTPTPAQIQQAPETPPTSGENNPYTETNIGIDSGDIKIQELPEQPTSMQDDDTIRQPELVDNTSTINTPPPTNTYRINIFEEEPKETSTVIKPPTVLIQVKPYISVTQSTGTSVTPPTSSPVLVKVNPNIQSPVTTTNTPSKSTVLIQVKPVSTQQGTQQGTQPGTQPGTQGQPQEPTTELPILSDNTISVITENIINGIRNPVYESITGYGKDDKLFTQQYKIFNLSEAEIKKYDAKDPIKVLELKSNSRYVYIDRSPPATSPTSAIIALTTNTLASGPKPKQTTGLLYYLDMNNLKLEEELLEKMDSPDIGYSLVKIQHNSGEYYFITRLDYKQANEKYKNQSVNNTPPTEYPLNLETNLESLKKVDSTTASYTYKTFTDFLKDHPKQLFSYKSHYFQKELIGSHSALQTKFAQTKTNNEPALYIEI